MLQAIATKRICNYTAHASQMKETIDNEYPDARERVVYVAHRYSPEVMEVILGLSSGGAAWLDRFCTRAMGLVNQ